MLRFLLFTIFCSCLLTAADRNASKPNIVFILADDLGWQDVGFMGSTFFETPNLDALAKEGVVFTDAYMYPTCSPSRAAMYTGKHSFRTQCYRVPVTENQGVKKSERGPDYHLYSRWTVTRDHKFYSEVLRDAGYKLIHLGKYHAVGPDPLNELKLTYPFKKPIGQHGNGDMSWLEEHKSAEVQKYYPLGRGYHENVGGSFWGDPARGYKEGYNAPGGGYVAPFKNPFIEPKKNDDWLSDRLTDEAIDFMKRHKDEPFFVDLHFYAPHKPTIARSEEALKKFQAKKACPVTGQDPKLVKQIAAFATMVENIDHNVKRVVDYLEEAGLKENTIIIFTSDNGCNRGQSFNKNLKGFKFSLNEGGSRVPAMIHWPKKWQPAVVSEPIVAMDYFPTFLELAGIKDYKGIMDGKSLFPLLEGKELNRNEPLYWHLASNKPCTIMRKGDWKITQFHLTPQNNTLYNLKSDLGEKINLIKKKPEVAKELLKEMSAWRRANEVPLPAKAVVE